MIKKRSLVRIWLQVKFGGQSRFFLRHFSSWSPRPWAPPTSPHGEGWPGRVTQGRAAGGGLLHTRDRPAEGLRVRDRQTGAQSDRKTERGRLAPTSAIPGKEFPSPSWLHLGAEAAEPRLKGQRLPPRQGEGQGLQAPLPSPAPSAPHAHPQKPPHPTFPDLGAHTGTLHLCRPPRLQNRICLISKDGTEHLRCSETALPPGAEGAPGSPSDTASPPRSQGREGLTGAKGPRPKPLEISLLRACLCHARKNQRESC